jgi:hypothetical protein
VTPSADSTLLECGVSFQQTAVVGATVPMCSIRLCAVKGA